MPFEKYYDATLPVTTPPCMHMRSKAMYVTGDFNPEHPDESGGHYCWCNQTQHVKGPDDQAVARGECVPTRACYEGTS